jgi:hypothetical protein
LYAPVVIDEISNLIFERHSNLASPIAFPLETPDFVAELNTTGNVFLKPLLDLHKVFLRAQFYALQIVVHWSSVVKLLSIPRKSIPHAEHARLLTSAKQSIYYGVFHIYAA